jgi:hypothetical protein
LTSESVTSRTAVYGPVREFWYSSKLGFNLVSILDSPRTGKQVTVTEISIIEPDVSFFTIPEGYMIPDIREGSPPQQ